MKTLLQASAALEIPAGIALLLAPALLVPILVGTALDAPAGVVVARVAGAALLSLGVACWLGSRDAKSPAAVGIVAAMLVYNGAVMVLLLAARYYAGLAGMGLLPAAALHAGMMVWCVLGMRAASNVTASN